MEQFDYSGIIESITKRDSIYVSTKDGLVHEMSTVEYDEQVDFAQFVPRRGTELRGFRVIDDHGHDIEYKYYFCR